MTLKIECQRCGIRDAADGKDLRVGARIDDHRCSNPFCIHGMGVVVKE